ncbi:hypothetical protein DZC71_00920 [Campylobacter hepaticus]|uniref:EexN family lipoprotein n=1 Tax=Campylobacter hepaticus TaxID=1813019 RepID=A0A424Z179_9BACT|nr:EexN family lipoprotein [Campylobacter hepaticus]RQD68943.1 hypothetical protein DZC71_00920 [Campylobacter hepaticus]RQD87902.1 hypothetical protein DZD40_03085 [Campylobacter hepaticus]
MQKLGIFFIIFIMFFITACDDDKMENYYKTHPSEAKEKAKKCKERNTLSKECIHALKIGIKPTHEESKYSPNIQSKFNNKISNNKTLNQQTQILKQENKTIVKDLEQNLKNYEYTLENQNTKDFDHNLENNDNIVVAPMAEEFSEVYPSKMQNSTFGNGVNLVQEKLP